MINEDYLVAGIRQQISALERLLQELRREPTHIKEVIPRIRTIEAQLKSLRDQSATSRLTRLP